MPFLLAIPAGEGLLWLGGITAVALGWYVPGGGRDQVEKALTSRTTPPVMQMSPAQQSEQAESEAGKEAGASTESCPGCPPAQGSTAVPPLPANPDDLLGQGWEETTDPRAAANSSRRTFRNLQTGQQIEFYKATPGADGFKRARSLPCAESRRDRQTRQIS